MPRHRKPPLGYPEPGQWVWERTQALPAIHPPEPLPDRQITTTELYDHITYEGLGHCLFCFSPEKLRGLRLRKLWKTAQEASKAIIIYLEEEEHYDCITSKKRRKKTKAVDFGEDATNNLEI